MPSICYEAEVGSATVVRIALFPPCVDITWYVRKIQGQPQGCWWKWCHITWMCMHCCSTLRVDSCTVLSSPNLVGHRTTSFKCGHVAALLGTCTLPSEIDLGLPSIGVPEIDTRLQVDSCLANFQHCLDLLNCVYNPMPIICQWIYQLSWMGLFGHRSLKRTVVFGNALLVCYNVCSLRS